MAASELNRCGWHIIEDKLASLTDASKSSVDSIIKKIVDIDLRDVGAPCLNEDINRGRIDYVEGPLVLQLQKLRVVSAPKDNEESQTAPKLCRLSLTDGHVTCSAVTLEPINGLGLKTPPGSKLQLTGTVEVESNFLLLTNKNTTLLGGRVDVLASPWELKKSLAQQSLTRSSARGEGGPPLFVPFGKKITNDYLPTSSKDNFKSLVNTKEKKESEEESEFQQQRQAALNQALQAKTSSGGVKTFGGSKIQVNDRDVARIAEMGFSAEDATSALKASSGNFTEALNSLCSGKQKYQRGGSRGGRGGRGDLRRRGRDRDVEDDADVPINTRPSGPATLFDFLETKIPTKGADAKIPLKCSDNKILSSLNSSTSIDSKSSKENNSFKGQQTKYDSSGGGNSQFKFNSQNKDFPKGNNQEQYGSKSSQNEAVAPRFVKAGRTDGIKNRNEGSCTGGSSENKPAAFSNQPRVPFSKDNNHGGRKGCSNYSSDSQDYRYSNNNQQKKYNYYHDEQQTFNDRNSEYAKRTYNQAGNYTRNYGDQGGFRKNNYQSNSFGDQPGYDRNSTRNKDVDGQDFSNRDGSAKYYKGQPNNRAPYYQPGLMPPPFSQQQFAAVPGKQGNENQQYPMKDSYMPDVGDTCLAKYWEDEEFYPAVINAISPNGTTAVVTYLEFENQEEVFYSDIVPLQPNWGFPITTPVFIGAMDSSLQNPSFYQSPTFVPPMEFTRGGMKRYENERRKPAQPLYHPPNQKSH